MAEKSGQMGKTYYNAVFDQSQGGDLPQSIRLSSIDILKRGDVMKYAGELPTKKTAMPYQ